MMSLNRNLDPLELSGIRAYTNLAKETPGCAMLTLGEPDFTTPEPICAAAAAAMAAGETHYAPNQGLPALRDAVAAYESGRGYPCDRENILITAGATGSIFTAMLGVLNPGDEVIVPMPAFPLYASIAAIAGAKVVPLHTEDFQITGADLARVMTEKTKIILLNSPSNPTGSVLTEESLTAVKAAVLGKDIYLLCDRVYDQLSSERCPDLSTDPELRQQILLCQSFSKTYAMTGWRIGYLAAEKALISRLLLLHAAELAAVPTFLQSACLTALKTDVSHMQRAYKERREYVCSRLHAMGLAFPKPEGAFYVFPSIEKFGIPDTEFCRRLITEGKAATVPGSCFGTPGYLRISYACGMDTLKTGLDRLENFIESL